MIASNFSLFFILLLTINCQVRRNTETSPIDTTNPQSTHYVESDESGKDAHYNLVGLDLVNSSEENLAKDSKQTAAKTDSIKANFNLAKGSVIAIRVNQQISSDKSKNSKDIYLSVETDVLDTDGNSIINKGAHATGKIILVKGRSYGRPGSVTLIITSVKANDGTDIEVYGKKVELGKDKVMQALLIGGVFVKGGNASIETGSLVAAQVTINYVKKQ